MYDDLITGVLGSPGLVDAAFSFIPSSYFRDISSNVRPFLISCIDLFASLSLWIRSTPLVLAVVSLLFIGFFAGIFFRIYHSC